MYISRIHDVLHYQQQQTARQVAQEAETITGEFVSTMLQILQRKNSIAIVGTMYEKSRKKDRVYDTSFIVNKNGKVTGKYRKIHLYDALGFKESNKMSSGSFDSICQQKQSVGKIGMMICYDLRFPEMSRSLAVIEEQKFYLHHQHGLMVQ